jgi:four helix bundle protein
MGGMNPTAKELSMHFVAFEVSLELIRVLKQPVAKIREHSRRLADQLDAASESVSLNLGEGRRRVGRDRKHLFRIADGSAAEVMAALRVAEARDYIDGETMAVAVATCDRLLRLTWGLTR